MNQAEIKRRQAGMLSEILSWLVIAFLGRVTGANGIAYLAAAWEAAELLWLLISGGTADTLGRLLRGRNTKGQYKNVMKMRRDILLLQVGFGILGSVLLFALSEWLMQDVFRMQYSSLILMILAPTVFLRSISETLTGCFRGEGTELPGTIAAFLRPVFILGFGLLFGKILAGYGNKVSALLLQLNFTAMYSSVGVAIAITVTELFLVLFLFLIYKGGPSPRAKIQEDGMRYTDSFFDCVRLFAGGRILSGGILFLVFLPVPLGLVFLQKAVAERDAAALAYGDCIVCYGVVCAILFALLRISGVSVTGKYFYYQRKGEQRYAKTIFSGGIHTTAASGIFAMTAIMVLSEQIAAVLAVEKGENVSGMLTLGAGVIPLSAMTAYFAGYLVLYGKRALLLGVAALTDVVYILSVTVFLNAGKMEILSLAGGALIAGGTACVALGFFLLKQIKCRISWQKTIGIPLGAACVTGLVMMLFAKLLTPHLGNLFTVILLCLLGLVLYWGILLVLRNFTEQELEGTLGGRFLGEIARRLNLL